MLFVSLFNSTLNPLKINIRKLNKNYRIYQKIQNYNKMAKSNNIYNLGILVILISQVMKLLRIMQKRTVWSQDKTEIIQAKKIY